MKSRKNYEVRFTLTEFQNKSGDELAAIINNKREINQLRSEDRNHKAELEAKIVELSKAQVEARKSLKVSEDNGFKDITDAEKVARTNISAPAGWFSWFSANSAPTQPKPTAAQPTANEEYFGGSWNPMNWKS